MSGGAWAKIWAVAELLLKQLVRIIAFLWIRDRKLVACGAWSGKVYGDSPKYLVEYILTNSDLKVVWIGNESVRAQLPKTNRVRFARMGSLRASLALLRARTWVCCISIEWDLTTWPLEGRALLINTWHGYSFKRNGGGTAAAAHGPRASLAGRIFKRLGLHRRPWLMIGGERDAEKLLAGDPLYFRADRILRTGTPTNDFLLARNRDEGYKRALREKYSRIIGFDPKKKIVTYLPTWRNSGTSLFSFYRLDDGAQEKWRCMLEDLNAVLIEKHHYRTLETYPVVGLSRCSIPISAEKQHEIDTNELLLITDVLISDYSGTYQDFGILGRPCIHFMYDLDDYINNCSGLVDGWRDMLAGPMIQGESELLEIVRSNLKSPCYAPAAGYEKTVAYQKGKACESVLKMIERC